MQEQVQTLAEGLFVLGVGEAFKHKWLLKKEKGLCKVKLKAAGGRLAGVEH